MAEHFNKDGKRFTRRKLSPYNPTAKEAVTLAGIEVTYLAHLLKTQAETYLSNLGDLQNAKEYTAEYENNIITKMTEIAVREAMQNILTNNKNKNNFRF